MMKKELQKEKEAIEGAGDGENAQFKWGDTFKVPYVFYFPFNDPRLEKPWNENKEKVDEYFNYGR